MIPNINNKLHLTLWLLFFLNEVNTHTSHYYDGSSQLQWFRPNPWVPISGPYTYGPSEHFYTPAPIQHRPSFYDHSSGVSQQQIVHIHDGGMDLPHGDHYQEGNDYNIRNIIGKVQMPLSYPDLTGQPSSQLEVRKRKPSNRVSNSKTSTKTGKRTQSNKNRVSQTKRRRRPSPEKLRSETVSKRNTLSRKRYSPRRNTKTRRQPTNSRRPQQIRRTATYRKRTRPTRKARPRVPTYRDYDYSGEYDSDEKQRLEFYEDERELYDDDEYFARQANDETTETESTVFEESTTEETSESTTVSTTETTTTASTTMQSNTANITRPTNGTDLDFQGYGPSNGNENISITYAPVGNSRFEHDVPSASFWYSRQGAPDVFRYRNYFSGKGFFK